MRKRLIDDISYSKWALVQSSLALCFVSVLLNISAIEGFWRWDDPALITHIRSYSVWQDLFNPAAWKDVSPSNFTPWLTLSFRVDLTLVGLKPVFFYLHQVVAIGASAAALNVLLALWLPPPYALSSSLLFLFGTPALLVAQQLMTRHYIEGLFFCLISLFLFVVNLRQSSIVWQIISAICYFLAILSKEIFFPLFLILFSIPEKNIYQRVRSSAPHILIAFLYIFWRATMLGSIIGGYTDNSALLPKIDILEVLLSFSNFPNLVFGQYSIYVTAVYLYFMSVFIIRKPYLCFFLVILLVSILAPLAPLVRFPGINIADRYLLLPWLVFSVSCGFIANSIFCRFQTPQTLILPRLAPLASLAIAGSAVLSSIETRRSVLATARQFDVVGSYLWNEDASTGYLPSSLISSSFWYVTDLNKLKQQVSPNQSSPLVIIDPVFLDTEDIDNPERLMEYNETCQCMRDSEKKTDTLLTEWRENEREDAPLTLNYKYVNNTFSWSFGPYEDGAYHIISNTLGITEVPMAGSQRVNLDLHEYFILRYTSPEGWTTHSASQTIDESVEEKSWRRP